jgi:HEAT repeat protein
MNRSQWLLLCASTTVLSTLAALLILMFLRESDAPHGSVSPGGHAPLTEELRNLAQSVEGLTERIRQLETSQVAVVRSPESTSARHEARPIPLAVMEERQADADSLPNSPARESRRLGNDRLAKLTSLRGSDNEAERLRIAREILADPDALGHSRALQVLLEADPVEGLAQLHALVERGLGDDPRSGAALWERAFVSLARADGVDLGAELTSLYQKGDRTVQSAAARFLRQRGDDRLWVESLPQVESDLRSPDPAKRIQALDFLANCGGPQSAELVATCLTDESPEVRLRALQAVPLVGDLSALSQIELLVNDPDERIRRRATQKLEQMRERQRLLADRRTTRGEVR